MKILISGCRRDLEQSQKDIIRKTMSLYLEQDHTLIHGGCSGVDTYIDSLAREKGWNIIVEKPDWSLGRRAGPLRNEKMIVDHEPDVLLAFPSIHSKGTHSCIKLANRHNLPVIVTDI